MNIIFGYIQVDMVLATLNTSKWVYYFCGETPPLDMKFNVVSNQINLKQELLLIRISS